MAMEDLGSSSTASTSPHTLSTYSFFTPLLISIMGIGATAMAILFYHLLLVRYCIRRHAARMAALQTFAGDEIPTGVDEKTLLTIPVIVYKKPDSGEPDQCECAVCLGDVENGDTVRLLPRCKHLFHVKCIDEWFAGHTSCPVCRVPVVAPPDEETRSCPICRSSVGPTVDDHRDRDHIPVSGYDDQTGGGVVVVGNGGGLSSGPRFMLRHCNSLVLPGEKKGRLTGMELKRSLSMGQSTCVIIDINIDNVDKDCTYYSSFRDQSIRHFHRVSSKVKQSISRMCVGQGQGQEQEQGSEILPY